MSVQGQQHTPSWVQREHRACYVYAHGLQRYSSHVFYMLPCLSWRFAHTISGNGASYLNPFELSHRKQTVELLSASLGGHHLPKPCNSSKRLLQISLLRSGLHLGAQLPLWPRPLIGGLSISRQRELGPRMLTCGIFVLFYLIHIHRSVVETMEPRPRFPPR